MQSADLLSTIAQIQQDVATLLKRGKPVSTAELEQLIQVIKAQEPPTLNSKELADTLGPYLQRQLVVPEAIQQASTNASASVMHNIRYASREAESTIQRATREGEAKILQAVAGIQQAAREIPQRVHVKGELIGFTSRTAAYLLVGFAALMLFTVIWAVSSRSHMQAELAATKERNRHLASWVGFYVEQRKELIRNHPAIAYKYFPHAGDPKQETSLGKQARK